MILVTGTISLIFASVVAGSCAQLSDKDQEFFRLPHREQERAILLYPTQKQLQLYMYGMTKIRPLAYHLVAPVASNGKKIVPLAIETLSDVTSEEELSAVLALLLQIDQDVYQWRADPDLVDRAKERALLLKNESWKQRVLRIAERRGAGLFLLNNRLV